MFGVFFGVCVCVFADGVRRLVRSIQACAVLSAPDEERRREGDWRRWGANEKWTLERKEG